MSEHLEGIRVFWDGKAFHSKQGLTICTPLSFLSGLPKVALDGILWTGRGQLESMISLIHSKEGNWNNVQFSLLDLPLSKETYRIRREELQRLNLPSHANIVPTEYCTGRQSLHNFLKLIIATGGNAVILKRADSFYVPEKTNDILIMKVIWVLL